MGPFAFGRISTTPNLGAGQGLRGVAPAAFSRLNNVPPGRPAAITNCESITSRTTGEGASQTKAAPLYVLFGRETDMFWFLGRAFGPIVVVSRQRLAYIWEGRKYDPF